MSDWMWAFIVLLTAIGFFAAGWLHAQRERMSIWQTGFDAAKRIYGPAAPACRVESDKVMGRAAASSPPTDESTNGTSPAGLRADAENAT